MTRIAVAAADGRWGGIKDTIRDAIWDQGLRLDRAAISGGEAFRREWMVR
jgi:hypothetical protein